MHEEKGEYPKRKSMSEEEGKYLKKKANVRRRRQISEEEGKYLKKKKAIIREEGDKGTKQGLEFGMAQSCVSGRVTSRLGLRRVLWFSLSSGPR